MFGENNNMIHNITKEQYINDPCGSSSIAYWKNSVYDKPKNIEIVHERDYRDTISTAGIRKYFRLFHDLKDIVLSSNDNFFFQNVNLKTQKGLVAEILSKCYDTEYSIEFVESLTEAKVFCNDLWVLIIEKATYIPVALGIADFDEEVKEGSLEWIQVLKEKRGLGLGGLIVNELLLRLKSRANFATVSGQVDNLTNPEILYRKCGFIGNDIWYVIYH